MDSARYGGLEAGGTKMICVVTDKNGEWLDQLTLPTLSPEETIPPIVDFF